MKNKILCNTLKSEFELIGTIKPFSILCEAWKNMKNA